MFESEAFSYSKPLGIQIGSNNRGPCPSCQHTEYDADWALPDGQHCLPGLQAQSLDPLHAGIYGLDEAGLLEGDAVGDLHGALLDDPIHDADVFGETAAGRLESGGTADFLVGGALGESLVPAVVTFAARDVMKHHDPVAGLELAHVRAYRSDHAGGFMTEDARGGMRACGYLFQVGAANSAGVHAQQQLSGADLRVRGRFRGGRR